MLEFLSRRLAAALVTLALATVVVFAVVEVLPGDPALIMLGTDARPDTLAALRAQYGFDQPLLVRYFHWIGGLLSFDLGTSHAYGTSVAKLIGDRLAVTLPLGALALCWALLVAIPPRVTRSAMLDTLREDYIRTARAKGAPERTVLFRHALRKALIPVTTVAGLIA